MHASHLVALVFAALAPIAASSAAASAQSGPAARDPLPYLTQGDSYRGLFRGVERTPRSAWNAYRAGDVARLVAQIDLIERQGADDVPGLAGIRRSAVDLAIIERSYLRGGISEGERRYLSYPYARLAYRLRTVLDER